MNVLFADTDLGVVQALQAAFADVRDVEAVHSPFEPLADSGRFDAIVSPANSYGIMDGGVDAAIIRHFGGALQEQVHETIRQVWAGEQPVGTCLPVAIPFSDAPSVLLHTPTMRVPQPIAGTTNVFLAFRAALLTADDCGITSILSPGLGTLTGRVRPEASAAQCRLAWDNVAHPQARTSWRHQNDLEQALSRAVHA